MSYKTKDGRVINIVAMLVGATFGRTLNYAYDKLKLYIGCVWG